MAKHTPPARQREFVDLWLVSDQSKAEFSRRNGLNYGTFIRWVKRHDHSTNHTINPTSTHSTGFLQVIPERVDSASGLTIELVGQRVHFQAVPPSAWFASVLKELGQC